MSDLPVEGTVSHPLRMAPGERIIEVHWGGLVVLVEATITSQNNYVLRSSDPLGLNVPRVDPVHDSTVFVDPLILPLPHITPAVGWSRADLKPYRVVYFGSRIIDSVDLGNFPSVWRINPSLGFESDLCTIPESGAYVGDEACNLIFGGGVFPFGIAHDSPDGAGPIQHRQWVEDRDGSFVALAEEEHPGETFRLVYPALQGRDVDTLLERFVAPESLSRDLSVFGVQQLVAESAGNGLITINRWLAVFAADQKEFVLEETGEPSTSSPHFPHTNTIRVRGYSGGNFVRKPDGTVVNIATPTTPPTVPLPPPPVPVFDQTKETSCDTTGIVARINRQGFVI